MSQLTHTGVRPHVCPECKATFTQRAMLNAHMKKHAAATPPPSGNHQGQIPGNQGQLPGSDVVPFLCASCGHGFRQRSALNSHSAVCSGAAAGKTAGSAGHIIRGGGHSNVAGNSKSAAAVPTPENSALLKTATVPIV